METSKFNLSELKEYLEGGDDPQSTIIRLQKAFIAILATSNEKLDREDTKELANAIDEAAYIIGMIKKKV